MKTNMASSRIALGSRPGGAEASLADLKRERRKLRLALGELIASAREVEQNIDGWMKRPRFTPQDRELFGKALAIAVNSLARANDGALYFGLGFDFHQDDVAGQRADRKRIMQFARRVGTA